MDFEDLNPKKEADYHLGQDISHFSVEDLEKVLKQLDAEKQRILQNLEQKKLSLNNAQSFFKES